MRRRLFPHRDVGALSALAIAMSTETRRPQVLIRVLMGALLVSLALTALGVGAAQAASSAPNIGIPLTPTTVAPGGTPTTATTASGVTPTTAAADTATPTSTPAGTATPTSVQGASAATTPLNPGLSFPQGTVQFLPEYDSTDVLVIIDYQLTADAKIPFTFQFRVPGNARMTGYSLIDTNGAFDYDRPVPTVIQGEEWDVVSVVVPKAKPLRIEYYYDPGLSLSGQRDFPVVFDPPATFDRLTLEVQEPRRATDFVVSPGFGQTTEGSEGFTFRAESRSGVQPGQPITAKVSYGKPDAEPSLPPADGTGGAAGGTNSAGTTAASGGSGGSGDLLWVLLAAVAAVAGIVAYRMPSGRPAAATSRPAQVARNSRAAIPQRPRPSRSSDATPSASTRPARASSSTHPASGRGGSRPQPEGSATGGGAPRFCTQCGDTFAPTDRFCSQCGEEREGA